MPSLKTGYLQKKPAPHKRFLNRYFVLSYSSLTYAKDPNTPLLGTINLKGALVRPFFDDSTKNGSVFILKTPHRTVYIRAKDDVEMMDWIHSIKTAIDSPSVDLIPVVCFSLFHSYFTPLGDVELPSVMSKNKAVPQLLDDSDDDNDVDIDSLL
ncbi:hypothetical protein GEMRC1_000662 [Eukaryota sp. GEM-RC1]